MTTRAEAEAAAAAAAHRRGVLARRAAMVLTVVAVTVLFVAMPMRSYLAQQSDVEGARASLAEIDQGNKKMAARLEHLSDPDEIARIARRDYGLVQQGEESYAVLPPPSAGLVLPRAWPFDRIEAAVRTASGG